MVSTVVENIKEGYMKTNVTRVENSTEVSSVGLPCFLPYSLSALHVVIEQCVEDDV
jgi:hypothetical protein